VSSNIRGSQPGPSKRYSEIVNSLEAIPSDAIVIRGYLGQSDLLQRTLALLTKLRKAPVVIKVKDGAVPTKKEVKAVAATFAKLFKGLHRLDVPWRIYLSPRLDSYVEFRWADVVAYQREDEADRDSAYTVWLRQRPDTNPYRVVTTRPLSSATGYVRGALVEDYMQREQAGGSSGSVWDEQSYLNLRPTTRAGCSLA